MPLTPPPNTRGTLERIYVLLVAGTLIIALAFALLAVFVAGRMTQQTDFSLQLAERVEALEQAVAETRRSPAAAGREPARGGEPHGPTSRPSTRSQPSAASTPQPAIVPALSDEDVRATYLASVAELDGLPAEIRNEDRVRAMLGHAAEHEPELQLSAESWLALALMAQLLKNESLAESWASRAQSAGQDARLYHETAARRLLAANRPSEALHHALALRSSAERRAAGVILLARCFMLAQRPDDARHELRALAGDERLSLPDRLALAHMRAALEDWDGLGRALEALQSVPDEFAAQRDFLAAVHLTSIGDYAQAVAILDYLLAHEPADYDALTWRGVALLRAAQPEAARETLMKAVSAGPGRPDAWYWLGVVHLRQENSARAAELFHNALAASSRYAPAWEALASLALNAGELGSAEESLREALKSEPGRATAHFMLAITLARGARRDEAAAELRTAIELDRKLSEQVAQVEVLARMFPPEALAELGATVPHAPNGQPPPSSSSGPAENP
ncbi:MAG: Beta-barrel assembly-enhancing protease [Phycisphaerae bacterium]|nr:Beta-barrel assembly-enhancing protease [Phycisphaerae bacterium]